MEATTPTTVSPYSLDQDCHTESRQFLGNKHFLAHVADGVRRLKLETKDPHDAFVDALDSISISDEEALPVAPLIALPDIAAIACTECEHTLPATETGLAKHLQSQHTPAPLSFDQSRDLKTHLRDILLHQRVGGLSSAAAFYIPHGIHFFPSLTLRLDGIACAYEDCGWVWVAGATGKGKNVLEAGKRHMDKDHGVCLLSDESYRSHLIFPLPVQRVERLERGGNFVYFVTALPPGWVEQHFGDAKGGNGDVGLVKQLVDGSAVMEEGHLCNGEERMFEEYTEMAQPVSPTPIKREYMAVEGKKKMEKKRKREGETPEERTERKRRKKERKKTKQAAARKGDHDGDRNSLCGFAVGCIVDVSSAASHLCD